MKLLSIAAIAGLVSCSNDENHKPVAAATPAAPVVKSEPSTTLGKPATDDLMALMASYYELKDALVATNATKADVAAARVMSAAETMKLHVADAPVKTTIDSIMQQSEAIVNTKDETCEKKRVYFEQVSNSIYGLAKTAGLKNGGIYRQFCPMAFNDKGAFWMSDVEEIRNPYFGKKMLGCGEVTDSL